MNFLCLVEALFVKHAAQLFRRDNFMLHGFDSAFIVWRCVVFRCKIWDCNVF